MGKVLYAAQVFPVARINEPRQGNVEASVDIQEREKKPGCGEVPAMVAYTEKGVMGGKDDFFSTGYNSPENVADAIQSWIDDEVQRVLNEQGVTP